MNGLERGDALSPLLFNFALEYTIRRVQVNQGGLKLNGTHQHLVNADDVNILGGSVHAIKENIEALVVAIKEIGLEVNADKTKKMSCLEIRMQDEVTVSRLIIVPFERVREFRYSGTTLTILNSIQEEIKSGLKSGNACYHSVQNLMSSILLSKI